MRRNERSRHRDRRRLVCADRIEYDNLAAITSYREQWYVRQGASNQAPFAFVDDRLPLPCGGLSVWNQ